MVDYSAYFFYSVVDCELPSEDDPLAPVVRCDFAEFPNLPLIVPVVQVEKECLYYVHDHLYFLYSH